MTAEEFNLITAALYDRIWDDSSRFADCLTIALGTLGELACPPEPNAFRMRTEATQALRQMMLRVIRGELEIETGDHQ